MSDSNDLRTILREEKPTTLIITRHVMTVENSEGIVQGAATDSIASREGMKQAEKLANALLKYDIDVIYSSPMVRCMQSIIPYLVKTDVPVHYLDELIERNYGIFDGAPSASFTDWKIKNKTQHNFDFHPPGGESFNRDVLPRVRWIKDYILKKEKGKTVMINTHSAIDTALLLSIFNQKPEDHYNDYRFSNASITVVDFKGGNPQIRILNSTEHLEGSSDKTKVKC